MPRRTWEQRLSRAWWKARLFVGRHAILSCALGVVVLGVAVLVGLWDWGVVSTGQLAATWRAVRSAVIKEWVAVVLGLLATVLGVQVHEWSQNRATIEVGSRWSDGELAEIRGKMRHTNPLGKHPPKKLMEMYE